MWRTKRRSFETGSLTLTEGNVSYLCSAKFLFLSHDVTKMCCGLPTAIACPSGRSDPACSVTGDVCLYYKKQRLYEWACNLFFFSYLLPQYFIFLLNSQCPRNLRAAFLLLCSWADISELPTQLYLSLKGFVLVLTKSCMYRTPFGGKQLVILSKYKVLKIHRVNFWVVTEDLTRKAPIYSFCLTLGGINGIQTEYS